MSHYLLACFVENKKVEEAKQELNIREDIKRTKKEKKAMKDQVARYLINDIMLEYDEELAVEKSIIYTRKEVEEIAKEEIKNIEEEYLEEELFRIFKGIIPDKEILEISKNVEDHYLKIGKIYLEDYDFDEEGNAYIMINPNAKWDWYVVGGRWDLELINKEKERSNIEKLKDIDFEAMHEEERRSLELSYEEAEKEPIFKNLYDIKEDETKEDFVRRKLSKPGSINTFAAIIDDEWYEKGTMGWFGMHDGTKETEESFEKKIRKFIEDNKETHAVIMVDCHI